MSLNRRNASVSRFCRGVSLVELLIGLVVGSLITAGALTVFAKISFSGIENVRMVRLNEQLRNTLDQIRRDLQRAGYVDAWPVGGTTISNLNVAAMGVFGAIEINGAGNCITYSYDVDKDAIQDDDEVFGFGLSGTAVNRDTTLADCDDVADWEPYTDGEVNIEVLSFALVQPSFEVANDAIGDDDGFCDAAEDLAGGCTPNPAEVGNGNGNGTCESGEICVARRKIVVVLEGSLASDSAFTVRLRDEIKVRNDRYFTMP